MRHNHPDPLMIALTIPFPPSANGYIRHSKGMHFPTAKAKQFRKDVAALTKAAGIKPLAARLHVTLTLYAPTRAQRDIDNYVKPTLDALMHAGCFVDDEQIDELHIHRGPLAKGGAIKVLILAHTVQPTVIEQLPLLATPITARQQFEAEVDARVPLG